MTDDQQEAEADRAFASLLALNPSHAARGELMTSNVPQHTVDLLYPIGFISLTPHLIEHVESVSDEHLLIPAGVELTTSIAWGQIPLDLQIASDQDSDADDEAAKTELKQTFASYMANRLGRTVELLDEDPAFARRQAMGTRIAQGTWAAHWLMNHRDQLPETCKPTANQLMLAIAQIICI